MTNKERFLALVSEHDSSVLEQIRWRRENRSWLKRSQAVALMILHTLRAEGLKQTELAQRLNVSPQQVSKWVKGKENFTFETISKIEVALDIELMSITGLGQKEASNIQIIEVRYSKPEKYTPIEIEGKHIETRCIPFKSNIVSVEEFDKAI